MSVNGDLNAQDTINFSVGNGPQIVPWTVQLTNNTLQSLTIDGTTQPGFQGTPLISAASAAGALASLEVPGINNVVIKGIIASNLTLVSSSFDTIEDCDFTGGGPLFTALTLKQWSDNNLVEGSYFGVDASGQVPTGVGDGIDILTDSSSNTIGGTTSSARNIISGNPSAGIYIGLPSFVGDPGSVDNLVVGNYIGTDSSGSQALPNGVGLFIGTPDNTVGGTTAGSRNVISGNDVIGLQCQASDTTVEGNYIGPDASGQYALGNGAAPAPGSGDGIVVFSLSFDDVIGGTEMGAGNVISGNDGDGILLLGDSSPLLDGGNSQPGPSYIAIEGNYIGTDASGDGVLGNGNDGVEVMDGATWDTIGGTEPGAGNVISGNGTGVAIHDAGTTQDNVEGNLIGTDATGEFALGNVTDGVEVYNGAISDEIGGTEPGAGNVISGNGPASRSRAFLHYTTTWKGTSSARMRRVTSRWATSRTASRSTASQLRHGWRHGAGRGQRDLGQRHRSWHLRSRHFRG